MNGTAVYTYAITRLPGGAREAAWAGGLVGIDGAAVKAIDCGEITALVSDVDLAQFGEQALPHNLEDLAWVERVVREHDRVVRQSAEHATVVPLRLATIFTSVARVRDELVRRRDASLSALERVTARAEWGVKAYLTGGTEPQPEPASAAAGAAGPGHAYVQRRRAQLQQQEQALGAAAAEAEQVYAALSQLAVAGRRHAPQDPRLSGRQEPMVLNAAFLVEDARADTFAAAVAQADAEYSGLDVELTGPWPPYSFATLEPE